MICPWCKDVSPHGKLCPACRRRAVGIGQLSGEELDALPYGVLRLNREGVVLSVNQAEARMFGSSPLSYIGQNFFRQIAPCSDVKTFGGRFKAFLDSGEPVEEFRFRYAFPSGGVSVWITFVRDTEDALLIISKTLTNSA